MVSNPWAAGWKAHTNPQSYGGTPIIVLLRLSAQSIAIYLGYAFSGGGNKIWRVDLSIDQGKTWIEAKLENLEGLAEPPRHWSWTIWSAKIPVPKGANQVEIWYKVSN